MACGARGFEDDFNITCVGQQLVDRVDFDNVLTKLSELTVASFRLKIEFTALT